MTGLSVLVRPAGLALGLLILSATAGCAHFRNAEVRAQERAGVQHNEPPMAQAVPPPPIARSVPPPIAAPEPPAPAQLPSVPPAPTAAMQPLPPAPEVTAQAVPIPSVSTAAPTESITPVAPPPSQTVPPPFVAPHLAPAPATNDAIIIFANTPSANCETCETLKISVAPSGQVLMERGSWTTGHGNWHYKRSRANVGPDRAAAFADLLSADRPVGVQAVGTACSAPATGDAGLSVEWIEADRDDRLAVQYGCPAGAGGSLAQRLRHAPDLLGLRQLAFP